MGILDPNNGATLSCTIAGVPSTFTATYPFNSDPNVERIHVSADLAGAALSTGDPTVFLDVAISRLKTTGVSSCVGCASPVQLTLRSVRVIQGDVCTQAPGTYPPDQVFLQRSGLNTVRWQSATPVIPISIDATELADPSFQISGGPCRDGSRVQDAYLAPGSYNIGGCGGAGVAFRPAL